LIFTFLGEVEASTCIFANTVGVNVSQDSQSTFTSLGHNLFTDKPTVSLDPTDLTNTDPLLGTLADNGGPTSTMALLPGSPAIDAGAAVAGVTTDQRGISRPQGAAPDIGAFESNTPVPTRATLSVLGSPAMGQPLTLVSTVVATPGNAQPSGVVTFRDGTTVLASVPLARGAAVLRVPVRSAGYRAFSAVYEGNGGTYPSLAPFAVEYVPRSSTTTYLTSSAPAAVYGQSFTYTAAVRSAATTPTGMVVFTDGSSVLGSASVVGGQASLTVLASGVGLVHPVVATYSGDANDAASTSVTLIQSVQPAATTVRLVTVPAAAGGYWVFAVVGVVHPGAGYAGGTATLLVNGVAVSCAAVANNVALLYLPRNIPVGRPVTVYYSGDANVRPAWG
jgi:hypothetical protein